MTKPFKGSYTVTADKNGIRFSNQVWENPALAAKRKLEDIAPFALLPKDAWDVKGVDLSIPYDESKTGLARSELDAFLAELGKHKGGSELQKIRVIAYHNLRMAKEMLQKL